METRNDRYGRPVTLTIEGNEEVYTNAFMIIRGPIGWGWNRALWTIEAHAPVADEAVTE